MDPKLVSNQPRTCRIDTIVLKKTTNNQSLIVYDNTNLVTDLGLDSILLMMLVTEIEVYFDIQLPDDFFQIEKLSKFNLIVEIVTNLVLQKKLK